MRKILIASHGRIASGVKSAIKILVGDDSAVTAIDCYVDESDFTPAIQAFIDGAGDDERVIFTDILGGSVCNKVMLLNPEKAGVYHVTGFNLGTVIECLLSPDPITPAVLDSIIAGGCGTMRRVSVEVDETEADDGDDFFA